MSTQSNSTVLWADDDRLRVMRFTEELKMHGLDVVHAATAAEAIHILQATPDAIRLAVVDVVIPKGDTDLVSSLGDLRTGLMLANWIKRHHPAIQVVGYSLDDSPDIRDWFDEYGHKFFSKRISRFGIVDRIRDILTASAEAGKPRIFIVHGHDESMKLQLKNYLQNTLGMGEPVILHERPSLGRTIIEKFEGESEHVDVVFVLFSPDEVGRKVSSTQEQPRARPNVLFEAGYFYAKLERTSGKIVFLVKGDVELPSDIAGVVYIDVSAGIEAAGESIRRELRQWLPRQ